MNKVMFEVMRYFGINYRPSSGVKSWGPPRGGGRGAMPPPPPIFFEKINEFLNFTIDF